VGLTIRYKMTPQPDWSWEEVRRRLVSIGNDIKAHCDFAEVEEVQEFRRTRLCYAHRLVHIPELAYLRFDQNAKRVLILATRPGPGTDQCKIGCAEYPSTLRHSRALWIDWREVLDNPKQYPVAVRTFRAFAAKHRFQIVRAKRVCRRWYKRYWPEWSIDSIGSARVIEYSEKPGGCRRLAIGWALRNYDEPVLMLADDTEVEYTTEMRKDLERLQGRGTYQIAKTREWQSLCETYDAIDPSFGCVRYFLRVHQGVCAALKICEEHGFVVEVEDESGFWGNWDVERLLQQIDAPAEERDRLFEVIGDP